jgi:hypothetical protein
MTKFWNKGGSFKQGGGLSRRFGEAPPPLTAGQTFFSLKKIGVINQNYFL